MCVENIFNNKGSVFSYSVYDFHLRVWPLRKKWGWWLKTSECALLGVWLTDFTMVCHQEIFILIHTFCIIQSLQNTFFIAATAEPLESN